MFALAFAKSIKGYSSGIVAAINFHYPVILPPLFSGLPMRKAIALRRINFFNRINNRTKHRQQRSFFITQAIHITYSVIFI